MNSVKEIIPMLIRLGLMIALMFAFTWTFGENGKNAHKVFGFFKDLSE